MPEKLDEEKIQEVLDTYEEEGEGEDHEENE